jgi:hypothetical protein
MSGIAAKSHAGVGAASEAVQAGAIRARAAATVAVTAVLTRADRLACVGWGSGCVRSGCVRRGRNVGVHGPTSAVNVHDVGSSPHVWQVRDIRGRNIAIRGRTSSVETRPDGQDVCRIHDVGSDPNVCRARDIRGWGIGPRSDFRRPHSWFYRYSSCRPLSNRLWPTCLPRRFRPCPPAERRAGCMP